MFLCFQDNTAALLHFYQGREWGEGKKQTTQKENNITCFAIIALAARVCLSTNSYTVTTESRIRGGKKESAVLEYALHTLSNG